MSEMRKQVVTPELAAAWLRSAKVQRSLRETRVVRYARDMSTGRWGEDISPIVFDVDGNLANGQHRLSAVVRSGAAQEFWLLTGAQPEAIKQMDTGAPRSAGDQLRFEGVKHYTLAGNIARTALRYELYPAHVWSSSLDVSNAQIVEEVTSRPDHYQRAVIAAEALRRSLGTGKVNGPYGALCLLVELQSPHADMWDEWHRGVTTGASLAEDDARLALRSFFTRGEVKSWGKTQSGLIACINAWNKWVVDEPVRLIKNPRRDELPMKKVA